MNLFQLLKDVNEVLAKYCEVHSGPRIKAVNCRFKAADDKEPDRFEQDVCITFTRTVKEDNHEYGYLIDAVCDKETSENISREARAEQNKMFYNYHNFTVFREELLRYFAETEFEPEYYDKGMISIPLSVFRELMKNKVPYFYQLLPSDFYAFVRKMLIDEMDIFCFANYRDGFNRSGFAFQVKDLKERGINVKVKDVTNEPTVK